MSRKLRVAVVGLGVGKSHLEAYAKITDRFDVVAVCDLDEAKGKAVAAEFGVKRSTTRLADLLAGNDVDIYDICTPPYTHCDLIEQVLAAGFHVICEKPLVGSLAEADRIEAAQAAFYPEINLTAFIGLNSVSMSDLFTAASRTPFIGPSLTLPLFDSRRLSANLGMVRTQRDELIALFRGRSYRLKGKPVVQIQE